MQPTWLSLNNDGRLSICAIFEISDKDTAGKNLGIATKVTTKASGKGKLRIQLKHEPTDKSNAQNPGSATDVDIEFPVIVK